MTEINQPEICEICCKEIQMQVYKGTGVCCALHEEVRAGKITWAEADGLEAKAIDRTVTGPVQKKARQTKNF